MSTRILTLFGEEIVPEPQKPAAKPRAKKGGDDAAPEAVPEKKKKAAKAEAEDTVVVPGPVVEAVVIHEPAPAEIVPAAPVAEPVIAAAPVTPVVVEPVKAGAPATPVEAAAHAAPAREKKPKKEKTEEDAVPADIIPEDWHGDKKYYTIGEVSEFFKVKTSHIRFWTNEFKLKVRTTRKGDRLYTPEHVKELRAIYHLVKERGFTLSGAKTKLKAQNKMDVTTVDLKTSLQELRGRLVILRDQLV